MNGLLSTRVYAQQITQQSSSFGLNKWSIVNVLLFSLVNLATTHKQCSGWKVSFSGHLRDRKQLMVHLHAQTWTFPFYHWQFSFSHILFSHSGIGSFQPYFQIRSQVFWFLNVPLETTQVRPPSSIAQHRTASEACPPQSRPNNLL